MNKQQLAAKIWESANKMRSKIEANEYKDYILGFIFYKFLSETEIARLRAEDWGAEDLKGLDENDAETVQYVRDLCGYFISYNNLFSTWIARFPLSNATLIRLVNVCSLASSTRCKPVCPNSAPMKKVVARLSATSSTSSRTFRWTAGRTTTPSASSMSI